MIYKIDQVVIIGKKKVRVIIYFDKKLNDKKLVDSAFTGTNVIKMMHRKLNAPLKSPFYSDNAKVIKDGILRMFYPLVVLSLRNCNERFNDFRVQVRITNKFTWDSYATYNTVLSDSKTAYISVSFEVLIGRLLFYKRYAREVVKTIGHELTHHFDRKAYLYRGKLVDTAIDFMKQGMHATTAFFMLSIHDLRLEALANFNVRRFTQKINIDVGLIHDFRKSMDNMTKSETEEESEKYFRGKVSSKISKIGMMMSFFIALSMVKDKAMCPIYISNKEVVSLSLLDKVMKKHKKFSIKNVPEKIFDRAYWTIKKTSQTGFIVLYENACDVLKLSKRNRVVWNGLFETWTYRAWKVYEKHHNKKVKKAGYLV